MHEEEYNSHEKADAADDDVGHTQERVLAAQDGGGRQDDSLRPWKLLHFVTCEQKKKIIITNRQLGIQQHLKYFEACC